MKKFFMFLLAGAFLFVFYTMQTTEKSSTPNPDLLQQDVAKLRGYVLQVIVRKDAAAIAAVSKPGLLSTLEGTMQTVREWERLEQATMDKCYAINNSRSDVFESYIVALVDEASSGKSIGKLELFLEKKDGKWQVTRLLPE
ncbi:hypothetical protein JXA32_06890 [Candidatus Sumerlaeota bacterium]|nr:hypothetical protein [Candidatus Sumerlaeota bacterium]